MNHPVCLSRRTFLAGSAVAAATAGLALSGCGNTWYGVKEDTKRAGQATGQGIEKAGEKIQEIAK